MSIVRYLNVDCILRSDVSLVDFLSYLKSDVFVLWDEPSGGGSFIGFETNLVDTSGPEEDIAEFLRLFEPPKLKEALIKCKEKSFDIGFESGDFGDPINLNISPDIVSKISELGFSINIRVYPVPPDQ